MSADVGVALSSRARVKGVALASTWHGITETSGCSSDALLASSLWRPTKPLELIPEYLPLHLKI